MKQKYYDGSWLKFSLYPAGAWVRFGELCVGYRFLSGRPNAYPHLLFSERHGYIHKWRVRNVLLFWHVKIPREFVEGSH